MVNSAIVFLTQASTPAASTGTRARVLAAVLLILLLLLGVLTAITAARWVMRRGGLTATSRERHRKQEAEIAPWSEAGRRAEPIPQPPVGPFPSDEDEFEDTDGWEDTDQIWDDEPEDDEDDDEDGDEDDDRD